MNRNSNPMRRSVTKRSFWGTDALAAAIFAIAIAAFGVADPASAQTRRAFLLGEQRYSDQDIPSLTRSDNDASDVAADLEIVAVHRGDDVGRADAELVEALVERAAALVQLGAHGAVEHERALRERFEERW